MTSPCLFSLFGSARSFGGEGHTLLVLSFLISRFVILLALGGEACRFLPPGFGFIENQGDASPTERAWAGCRCVSHV